jgi:hypothetical protein
MPRIAILAISVAVLLPSPMCAQEWAEKMFTVRSYDFGNIARGAKAEYAFELTNLYLDDVHIASVRATCGCTTPRIEKDTLKTYEKGAIIAHINSDRFLGNQGATITVSIDRPFPAQVQLNVKVYVCSDVLLEPSSIALGSVGQGTAVERTIRVQYTGDSDWQILEVRSGSPHLSGTVTEKPRQDGRITYDLKAVLNKDAPVGYVNEHLWLITNDSGAEQIPVPVEGHVQADISVTPSSLFLGVVEPGHSVTKQIVIRGQKPFRISSIRGDCKCLQATAPKDQGLKPLYVVPITFTAPDKAGRVAPTIQIETDSGKTVLKIPTYAVVGGQP